VNQLDDRKRGNHGEHSRADTSSEKADCRPHGSPANRAGNQRIGLSDWRIWQQHEDGQRSSERWDQKDSNLIRFQGRQRAEHNCYPYKPAQAKSGPCPPTSNDG
jgi:hypothetical protein